MPPGIICPALCGHTATPELFSTFKEKFLVAPIVVLIVTALAQFNTLHGLFLMVLVWEIWHLFMQHYGIMRIYDAKNKIFSKLDARLDWLLTLCAFATVVVYSPEYFHRILDHNQRVGVPFLSAELTFLLKKVLFYCTMAVLAAYLANIVRRAVAGQKISLPKIAVMATTVFIIYYGWIHINDLVIGYAAFAVFHDIQYFAIVWIYNNNLVKRQERTTKLLRTFFTTRTLPILVAYVLVCFAYGSINMMEGFLKSEQAIKMVEIFVITSTLLHYYFDGFIWKIRDRKKPSQSGDQRRGGGGPHWIAGVDWRLALVLPRDRPAVGLFCSASDGVLAFPILLDGRRGRGAGEDGRIVPGLGRCPQQPRRLLCAAGRLGKGPPESMSGR